MAYITVHLRTVLSTAMTRKSRNIGKYQKTPCIGVVWIITAALRHETKLVQDPEAHCLACGCF